MAKKKKTEKTPMAQLEAEYGLLTSVTEGFRSELAKQISELLDDQEIGLGFPLESRVKRWDSIVNKLERLRPVN